jgi:hypothetical protein
MDFTVERHFGLLVDFMKANKYPCEGSTIIFDYYGLFVWKEGIQNYKNITVMYLALKILGSPEEGYTLRCKRRF